MTRVLLRLPLFVFTICLVIFSSQISASAFEKYKPGMVKSALANGQTVFVEFYAPWCPTCKQQSRVIRSLLAENPEYSKSIRFIRVSWDKYKNSEISKKYRVRRQATLVLVNSKRVLGMLVSKTSKSSIQRLIKKGI